MLYQPAHFKAPRAETLKLIQAHPFATVLALGGVEAQISHLPLLLAEAPSADGPVKLVGHMSRKNPQWEAWCQHPRALAMFHGPHVYVSPRWYQEHDVPTWNYAVVHVEGSVRLIESPKELVRLLLQLSSRFEGDSSEAWRFGIPEDLQGEALAKAIVGFEITAEKIDGKFKLGQNRRPADIAGVMGALERAGDEQSAGILALMRDFSLGG